MSRFLDFLTWLWSDWGRPNPLTRLGVPRIVTNLLTYLIWPFVIYLVMDRYIPFHERQELHNLVHNRWILTGYGSFYAVVVLDSYLCFTYSLDGTDAFKRFRVFRKNSRDVFVRTYWAALILSLLISLVGAFELWSRQR